MSEHITHTPTLKRLERSSSDKWIAGVCGGLARYFDLNPAVFRLGLVVLTLLGGAGILVYLAAVLVMPVEGKETSIAEDVLAERKDHPGRLIGLGLVAVVLFVVLSRAGSWPTSGAAWVLVLFAGLVLLWTGRRSAAHGFLIAVASLFTLFIVAVVVAVITAFAWFDVSFNDGIGDKTYIPTRAADVKQSYNLGIGNLRVDLSRVDLTKPQHVKAHVGIGELRVVVPHDASVVVNAHAKAGNVDALSQHDNGRNARVVVGNGNQLFLDAQVGAGNIDVVRAG